MTCPSCGAAIQPHDLFCINCGRQMTPVDPTRRLDESPSDGQAEPAYDATTPPAYGDYPAPPYQANPTPPVDPYARPAQDTYTQPASRPYARPTLSNPQPAENDRWAAGSSFPAPNPYTPSQPNTVSRGTILNGQPLGNAGGGILKGLGAAGVALLIALKSFGGAIAGMGIFKLFFLWSMVRWLAFGHSWLLILIVLLVVGAIWRSQTA